MLDFLQWNCDHISVPPIYLTAPLLDSVIEQDSSVLTSFTLDVLNLSQSLELSGTAVHEWIRLLASRDSEDTTLGVFICDVQLQSFSIQGSGRPPVVLSHSTFGRFGMPEHHDSLHQIQFLVAQPFHPNDPAARPLKTHAGSGLSQHRYARKSLARLEIAVQSASIDWQRIRRTYSEMIDSNRVYRILRHAMVPW
ncbi:MAG: hypothetical protein BYD32DRAFT_465975 [Podila humilis]|nr:MAG: hypothetical protein BYD32DRAFT_465975 [Podila humilis]